MPRALHLRKGAILSLDGKHFRICDFDFEGRVVLIQHVPNSSRFYTLQELQSQPTEWVFLSSLFEKGAKHVIPLKHTFSANSLDFSYHRSADCYSENLVLFLHGMGDSYRPFEELSRKMNLPQTDVMSLQAPDQLPYDLGFSWYYSLQSNGDFLSPKVSDPKREQSMQRTAEWVQSVLTVLHEYYLWPYDRVFLFGFAQGGTVALNTVLNSSHRFGGACIISSGLVGCALMESSGTSTESTAAATAAAQPETPVLMLNGKNDQEYLLEYAVKSRDLYARKRGRDSIELKSFDRCGGMIASQQEMRQVMKFFSSHLFLRNIEMEKRQDLILMQNNSALTTEFDNKLYK